MIDLNTEFGQRVARRLKDEETIWLTTISHNDIPQPRPVWFWWDGKTFLIYSQPDTYKLDHIARNPSVALNFNSDEQGDDIIVFTGEASIDETALPANEMAEYATKYEAGFKQIQMTADSFGERYSVAIRVKPTELRGH